MKSQKNHLRNIKIGFLIALLLPALSYAQYTPIVGIPGVTGGSFDSYMNSLYALSISLAALLAVIKIIIAGVKWMMTDVVTSKSEAKKDIQGALLGLLVVLSAVLILSIINDDLVGFSVTGSGGSMGTVRDPLTPTAPPTPSYTVNSASGYTWISTDENLTNRGDFVNGCTAAGNSVYYAFDAGEIRCQAPTATLDAIIRSYAPVGPTFTTADQNNFVDAYMDYINPSAVPVATLSAIETELESSLGEDWTIHFAIDTSTATVLEQTQFQGICEDVDQALGTDGLTGDQRVQITGTGTYLACTTLNR